MKEAKKRGGPFIDALTALQVEEREDLDPVHISPSSRAPGPGGQRPAEDPRHPAPAHAPSGADRWHRAVVAGLPDRRDPDARPLDAPHGHRGGTGREPALTADHDGILVDDVVREWAGRHGQPVSLSLTGPAGGSWIFLDGGPELELDAVDFCRQVGGRGAPEGLLKTAVPF